MPGQISARDTSPPIQVVDPGTSLVAHQDLLGAARM